MSEAHIHFAEADGRAKHRENIGLKWWHGWSVIVIAPSAVFFIYPGDWPRWGFMWSLAFAIYAGCKWLTWRRSAASAPAWKHLGYLFAWPGLDARAFLQSITNSRVDEVRLIDWAGAATKFATGILIFWGLARWVPSQYDLVVGWVGMIGMVLTLHFGLFQLLSCAWRFIGVDAQPLMNRPLYSKSIIDFWSVRWNSAFRDLSYRFLFRPLVRICSGTNALLLTFLVSGLIHDLVISIPAGGGYGGPTLFFSIQGLAILISRSRWGKDLGLQQGLPARWFAVLVLVLPLLLLFHVPFVREVIVPFMKDMGALP